MTKNILNDEQQGDADDEPLGYQHFLYDVNIEFSPGGNRNYSPGNKHSFKLKYLPYMVRRNCLDKFPRKSSLASSNSSICDPLPSPIINNDQNHHHSTLVSNNTQENDSNQNDLDSAKHIDVTKATCAFLGNSDYVPNKKFERRRVVLELISAKLSQPTTFNVPAHSSYASLVSLPEQSSFHNSSLSNTSFQSTAITSPQTDRNNERTSFNESISLINQSTNQRPRHNLSTAPQSPSALTSSKRFVNYTILIKTAPGLDNHPAVIERRFSDFLSLYQGLKCHEPFAKIVDKSVTFPKKVYMGNFSLTNIAERSLEFSRLLDLCMANNNLLWSVPFISFLIDKELKEAHKLSLCGDPDDVQALIETVYYIEQKLYLSKLQQQRDSANSSPSISLDIYNNGGRYSPILPVGRPQIYESPSNETISADGSCCSNTNNRPTSTDPGSSSSLNQSIFDTNEELDSLIQIKAISTPLNQRILVTFCMLFLTYYRGENYRDLKLAVRGFMLQISSQEYVDSLINTRHYMTLRACLLFLMNMNRGNVIDESQRIWLKRRLEDIDVMQADLHENPHNVSTANTTLDTDTCTNSPKNRKPNGNVDITNNNYRITMGDLTSLLRDRNFCSFQDGKFISG